MSILIDRRLNPRHRSAVNRQRFVQRYKEHIKKAVTDMVAERSITDMEKGGKVNIPVKDISEPSFRHASGGDRETVHPGNREFVPGDKVARPSGGSGEGGGEPGEGESTDSFVFTLSKEEFMNIFFDDLELPRLSRTVIGSTKATKRVKAGYNINGTPTNLSVARSMRQAKARHVALGGATRRKLKEARAELDRLLLADAPHQQITALKDEILRLERKLGRIPFIDTLDLRYHHRVAVPTPISRAVMFCLMDVSASMDEVKKDLAKRFFALLYMFLNRKYESVDVVFVRHTDDAEEVDEETFFYDAKSGGTVVLSALELAGKIIEARYPLDQWNIYLAQASDGDAFGNDATESRDYLNGMLLPKCRYYAYIEIVDPESASSSSSRLWEAYESLGSCGGAFAMKQVSERREIYPVLHDLFKRESA